MRAWMCVICGYVYEEEQGDPESGIAPGTRWEDIPLTWRCPDCGAGKEDFEVVEVPSYRSPHSQRQVVQQKADELLA